MPLLEKVRIELFIPDLPDPIYGRLVEELGDELSYAFGGCTVTPTQGKYRSTIFSSSENAIPFGAFMSLRRTDNSPLAESR